MLRITRLARTNGEEVLKVEGWLTGENVALLAQSGERSLARGGRLVLELGGVQSIDEGGIGLLQGWPAERLDLRGASVFIRQVLAQYQLRCADEEEEDGGR